MSILTTKLYIWRSLHTSQSLELSHNFHLLQRRTHIRSIKHLPSSSDSPSSKSTELWNVLTKHASRPSKCRHIVHQKYPHFKSITRDGFLRSTIISLLPHKAWPLLSLPKAQTNMHLSICKTLCDTIDDLICAGRIEPQLGGKIMRNFVSSVDNAFAENVKAVVKLKVTFPIA